MRARSGQLLARWEGLPARRQFLLAAAALGVVLFAIHEAFFPLLQWYDSLLYAALEGVLGGMVVTFATQTELARREQGSQDPHEPTGPDGRGDDGTT